MARLTAIHPDEASGKTKELFNGIHSKLGVVPNMMRTMGHSPALLAGYLNLSSSLSGGSLGVKTGELIALAVAESNACNYCLSVHTYLGSNLMKIDSETLSSARDAHSNDPKTNAILQFTKTLVSNKGKLTDADVTYILAAGVTEGEVGEIIGHVGLNILTNYFNNTAETEVDFPLVEAHSSATV